MPEGHYDSMAQNIDEEDDDALDDSWNDLPPEAFDALEINAIQSTQRQKQLHAHQTLPTLPSATVPYPSQQTNLPNRQKQASFDRENGPREAPEDSSIRSDGPSPTLQVSIDNSKIRTRGDVTQRDHWQHSRFAGQNGSVLDDGQRVVHSTGYLPDYSREGQRGAEISAQIEIEDDKVEGEADAADDPLQGGVTDSVVLGPDGRSVVSLQAQIQEVESTCPFQG